MRKKVTNKVNTGDKTFEGPAKQIVKAGKKPLTDEDGEVRELLLVDFAVMEPMAEVLPHLVGLHKKSCGRPRAAVKSVPKSIRLAADVAAHFEAMGRGWQTRMNEVLRELIHNQKI